MDYTGISYFVLLERNIQWIYNIEEWYAYNIHYDHYICYSFPYCNHIYYFKEKSFGQATILHRRVYQHLTAAYAW